MVAYYSELKNLQSKMLRKHSRTITMNQDSKWILLDAFDNGDQYEICDQYPFNIRNAKTKRILSGKKTQYGYIEYQFSKNGKRKYYKHHVLIYKTFVHFYEDPKLQIDHINGIRDDNHIENLKLCTQSENQRNRHFSKGLERKTFYDEENMILVQDDIYYHKRYDIFCRKCNDGFKLMKERTHGKCLRITYYINNKSVYLNTTFWREDHYYLF